ncbi:MAG: tetraacyldisaccharide 4'-kinase [Candidatus Hydrogenedentes bacterium]|nr:tetraacyldisaccharide 4'-kinase [Candidatus Hydrogenedentota bacterium]
MNQPSSLADRIRRGEPLPWYLDALLTTATPLYRLGMFARSLSNPIKVSARVISIGNITAGGTGKTPAVIERAQAEVAAGNTVAVLTRGYGAKNRSKTLVLAPGAQARSMAGELGDEPALIARRVPEVLIARGTDRVAAAHAAIDRGCNVLILDDGYQYLRLARDENVIVIDASNPFGSGSLIPRGTLREPTTALRRATHIILTHCDIPDAKALRTLVNTVREICPNTPIRKTRHEPDALWSLESGKTHALSMLQGAPITAVCGIAQPEHFIATLQLLGARVDNQRIYPDHADIPASAFSGPNKIIITEKDAARLSGTPPNVYALGIRLTNL